VDPVSDPLLLRKSGRVGNRTRDLWICSQKLWPLDHRGGLNYPKETLNVSTGNKNNVKVVNRINYVYHKRQWRLYQRFPIGYRLHFTTKMEMCIPILSKLYTYAYLLTCSVCCDFAYFTRLDGNSLQTYIYCCKSNHTKDLALHFFSNGSYRAPGLFFSSVIIFYTDGRTPWTSDKPVARPLPTQRTTQTQNKRIYRLPCLEGIRTPRSQRSSERRQFVLQTAQPL
jgi:hypothetical protein